MSEAPLSEDERAPEDYGSIFDEGDDGDDEWDGEGLEGDDELSNCHAFVDGGVFVCGAVGSEDCDECPFNCELGTKADDVDFEEETDDE